MSQLTYQGRLPDEFYYYWNLHTCDDGMDIYEYVWEGKTGKFLFRQVNGIQCSRNMIKLQRDVHTFMRDEHSRQIPLKNDWYTIENISKWDYLVSPTVSKPS